MKHWKEDLVSRKWQGRHRSHAKKLHTHACRSVQVAWAVLDEANKKDERTRREGKRTKTKKHKKQIVCPTDKKGRIAIRLATIQVVQCLPSQGETA